MGALRARPAQLSVVPLLAATLGREAAPPGVLRSNVVTNCRKRLDEYSRASAAGVRQVSLACRGVAGVSRRLPPVRFPGGSLRLTPATRHCQKVLPHTAAGVHCRGTLPVVF